jgi:hypothetical protein
MAKEAMEVQKLIPKTTMGMEEHWTWNILQTQL